VVGQKIQKILEGQSVQPVEVLKKKKRPTKSKENKFLQKNKTGTALVGLLCFDLVP
jgi:hypothetical protein